MDIGNLTMHEVTFSIAMWEGEVRKEKRDREVSAFVLIIYSSLPLLGHLWPGSGFLWHIIRAETWWKMDDGIIWNSEKLQQMHELMKIEEHGLKTMRHLSTIHRHTTTSRYKWDRVGKHTVVSQCWPALTQCYCLLGGLMSSDLCLRYSGTCL